MCSNEGPCPFQMGDNSKNIIRFKILFSRTITCISTKFGRRYIFVQMNSHALVQGEIIMTFNQFAFILIALLKLLTTRKCFSGEM